MTPKRRLEIDRTLEQHRQLHVECGDAEECCSDDELVRELLAELDRMQDDLHSGHTLVPFDERYHQASTSASTSTDRLGWLVCTRPGCGYETPAVGWCPDHRELDTCWAYTKREEHES